MKKILLLFVIIGITGTLVSAQTINDTASIIGNKPQIKIKVKKIYDENGNVTGYDSTYEWSYSNSSAGNSIIINPDSLFKKFKPYFDKNFIQFPTDSFSSRIFNDSTMFYDFFNNDHFFNRWQNELFNFQKDVKRMDSLKRIFFKKYIEKQEEEKNRGKIY